MVTSIGIGIANAIGFNRAKKGSSSTSPKPIASYRCYDKTNDDADRDVLTDLTGNGHDIQLYNFAFAESSGYGKYATDFTKWSVSKEYCNIENFYRAIITKPHGLDGILFSNLSIGEKLKVKITGLSNTGFTLCFNGGTTTSLTTTEDGIYEITQLVSPMAFKLSGDSKIANVIIEQIPDYQGALVSDGVDDYGHCENFPILEPDKGFTICAIRKYLSYTDKNNNAFISKSDIQSQGEFIFENNTTLTMAVYYSFGKGIGNNPPTLFSYQTSNTINGKNIIPGNATLFSNNLWLYCLRNGAGLSNAALYALEIYDRDLTDEEIAKVKERMITEYEAKTGNKYEEETA